MMKLFPPHWGKKRLPFLLFFFLLPNQYKIHHDCSFVAQIISLISRYRKIPLRYPVVCMSSRSYIYDLIPIKHSNPMYVNPTFEFSLSLFYFLLLWPLIILFD
eukprot:Sdes_comp20100_c0_seq1m13090